MQNKLRNNKDAFEKTRFRNVRDAPVDDHAGIEDLMRALRSGFGIEDSAQRAEIEQIAFRSAGAGAEINEDQKTNNLYELNNSGVIAAQMT